MFSKSTLIPLLYCKFECIWMNTDKEKGEGNKKKYWENETWRYRERWRDRKKERENVRGWAKETRNRYRQKGIESELDRERGRENETVRQRERERGETKRMS